MKQDRREKKKIEHKKKADEEKNRHSGPISECFSYIYPL